MSKNYKFPTYPRIWVKEGEKMRPASFIEQNFLTLIKIAEEQNKRIAKLEQILNAEVKV